jgi:hypothetical protein
VFKIRLKAGCQKRQAPTVTAEPVLRTFDESLQE